MTELEYLKACYYNSNRNADLSKMSQQNKDLFLQCELIYNQAMQGLIRTNPPFDKSLDCEKWLDYLPEVSGFYLVSGQSLLKAKVVKVVMIKGEQIIRQSLGNTLKLNPDTPIRVLRLSE